MHTDARRMHLKAYGCIRRHTEAAPHSQAPSYSQAHLISGPQLIPTLFPGTKWGRIFCGSLSKPIHPAPGASEVGPGAAALAPLLRDSGDPARSRVQFPEGHFLCAGIALDNHLLGTGRPTLSKLLYRLRQTKATSMAHQGFPERGTGTAQRDPKGNQSHPRMTKGS